MSSEIVLNVNCTKLKQIYVIDERISVNLSLGLYTDVTVAAICSTIRLHACSSEYHTRRMGGLCQRTLKVQDWTMQEQIATDRKTGIGNCGVQNSLNSLCLWTLGR